MTTISDADSTRFRRIATGAPWAVALISLVVAASAGPHSLDLYERAEIWVGLCAGPISGWACAGADGEVGEALPLLVGSTTLCVVPLAIAARRRSSGLLGLGALLWFGAGWFFTIAIWV